MAAPRSTRDARWDATAAPAKQEDVSRLHSALIGVLRLLREVDRESGVSPSRLSALSVLVFVGAMPQVALARIEGISSPSMSLLVRELEAAGLAERTTDTTDARRTIVSATTKGRELLLAGRRRRLDWLSEAIDRLPVRTRRALLQSGGQLNLLLEALRATHPTDT
jgi:DNA-binding MarR family transcriptional regulator